MGLVVSMALVFAVVGGAIALLVGVAHAHHNTVTESADCSGWLSKADYIGGNADRMVVVDVVIDGEVIQQTFYFDNAHGHLGRQTFYNLFERTGTGSVQTSGTIKLYSKQNGSYTKLGDTDTLSLQFDASGCAPQECDPQDIDCLPPCDFQDLQFPCRPDCGASSPRRSASRPARKWTTSSRACRPAKKNNSRTASLPARRWSSSSRACHRARNLRSRTASRTARTWATSSPACPAAAVRRRGPALPRASRTRRAQRRRPG
jgi:hypothetical protein